jgi:hypothetical protein
MYRDTGTDLVAAAIGASAAAAGVTHTGAYGLATANRLARADQVAGADFVAAAIGTGHGIAGTYCCFGGGLFVLRFGIIGLEARPNELFSVDHEIYFRIGNVAFRGVAGNSIIRFICHSQAPFYS